MDDRQQPDEMPTWCRRCGAEIRPGRGDCYLVGVVALADPSPPQFSEEDLGRDLRAEIADLIDAMQDQSDQDLMDQVYRRLIFYLCGPCYRAWIENPTG